MRLWAKTKKDGTPGIEVFDHCVNVGRVAEAIIETLPPSLKGILPPGAATLSALHDIGKATIGFQVKCPVWQTTSELPGIDSGEVALSVTDHALVSQVHLQNQFPSSKLRLWAVAVGAHHGQPKGKNARIPFEAMREWAEENRGQMLAQLVELFGPLPDTPPDPRFEHHYSDLWLLAGLITVADWIGSNEAWFPSDHGLPPDKAKQQGSLALHEIGWPGGKLKETPFKHVFPFEPNQLQQSVLAEAKSARVLIVEGPMGCGKTEAALAAAQSMIASGKQQGIYFALPTQVTSNRIHQRIRGFLRNTLDDVATLRLAHGNAWLEDDFTLQLNPSFPNWEKKDGDSPAQTTAEARSWFTSAKRALLAPYGVGTIDQALQGVVAVKHFFVRRFALAGKVVILDEVHSYDIYTGTLIAALIRELVNLNCAVIVLSATLTAERRKELLAAASITESEATADYPLVTSGAAYETGSGSGACRHISIEWEPSKPIKLRSAVIPTKETVNELITRAEAGQHVLWIRNTVSEAQEAFRTVAATVREGSTKLGLLHSRFPFQRRAELEADWLEHLGPKRSPDGPGSILVATQVVEQSVDIDLDFIVSDLAPTDMLLQRMGRLWRHQRDQRNAEYPEFWIRLPEIDPNLDVEGLKRALGKSARVYAPYVLLRTMEAWSKLTEATLPTDIRPVLEDTYAAPSPKEPAVWKELRCDLENEKAELAANAEAATRVLSGPMLPDGEEILTRRKGAPTQLVLLLRSVEVIGDGTVNLEALDGSTAKIDTQDWRRESAKFLHQWFVRAPSWMIPKPAPHPDWLSLHGPTGATVATVGDDGRCILEGRHSSMSYNLLLGIYAGKTA
ncbi:MAG: CRISPR-associated helicase Cas3' [Limisphaerales bacterium]